MPPAPSRLAVLVDADNVPPDAMDSILLQISGLGDPIIRQIYGNVNATSGQKWSRVVVDHAFSVMRHTPQSIGENATDIEMVIGAMDLLASRNLEGFCLVTSDSDFTALAIRLRESGKYVYGFGGDKTRASFRKACRAFHVLPVPEKTEPAAKPAVAAPADMSALLMLAFQKCETRGWALLSPAGQIVSEFRKQFKLAEKQPGQLSKLIAACDGFELGVFEGKAAYRPARPIAGSSVLQLVKP